MFIFPVTRTIKKAASFESPFSCSFVRFREAHLSAALSSTHPKPRSTNYSAHVSETSYPFIPSSDFCLPESLDRPFTMKSPKGRYIPGGGSHKTLAISVMSAHHAASGSAVGGNTAPRARPFLSTQETRPGRKQGHKETIYYTIALRYITSQRPVVCGAFGDKGITAFGIREGVTRSRCFKANLSA